MNTGPVGELLLQVGGKFDETSVTLSAYSERLDRHRVTALLGVNPSEAWDPGERHPLGKKGKTRICDWGKWVLSIEYDTRPVEDKIRELLGQCTQDISRWQQLASDYDIWLTVSGHLNSWNRELNLSSKLLRMLTDRNLDLKVDVYFYGDDEEEESDLPSAGTR